MKRSEILFSVVQVPVDYVMIVLAAVSVFLLRDVLPEISDLLNPKVYSMTFKPFLMIAFMVAPLFIVVYAIEGLYTIRSSRSFWKEAFMVFRATSLGIVTIIIAVFLERDWFSSRFIILAGWFASASEGVAYGTHVDGRVRSCGYDAGNDRAADEQRVCDGWRGKEGVARDGLPDALVRAAVEGAFPVE